MKTTDYTVMPEHGLWQKVEIADATIVSVEGPYDVRIDVDGAGAYFAMNNTDEPVDIQVIYL
jgi:hypothetical protein